MQSLQACQKMFLPRSQDFTAQNRIIKNIVSKQTSWKKSSRHLESSSEILAVFSPEKLEILLSNYKKNMKNQFFEEKCVNNFYFF